MHKILILRACGLVAYMLICVGSTQAQPLIDAQGAEAQMLGGASCASTNLWSVCNNPAGMSGVYTWQLGVYTEQRYTQTELKTGSIAVVKPVKSLLLGASVSYYGFDAFNQQRHTLSVSKSLTKSMRLGVQSQYLGTFIRDYGSTGNWLMGLGLQVQLVKPLTLGVFLFNPTQSKYGKYTQEKIQTFARLGCNYSLSDKVNLLLEAQQQLEHHLNWHIGIQYRIHNVLQLAIGSSTLPTTYTFGLQLKVMRMQLDVATSIHQVLGFTPHFGLSLPI